MIYLDAAATTLQKPAAVARAMERAMRTMASPGRGGYEAAARAAETVFDCRLAAAKLFDCSPEQVVFTMNATHGLNLAIRSLVQSGRRVVISGFEHNAVRRPLHVLGAQVIVTGRSLFDTEAILDAFDRAITCETSAVICTHVSNVFGFVLPVRQIGALCRARGVPWILDASQSAGCLPVSLRELGAAFIAMPGHKGLYGPQGTGLLLCAADAEPLIAGGTGSASRPLTMPEELPERLEAGTQNICGIAGLKAGLEFLLDAAPQTLLQHEQRLCRILAAQLRQMEGVRIWASEADDQSGVLSFQIDGLDCEDVAQLLAQQQIAVRAGLHCAPLAHESAGTLPHGTIRVSFSAFNTERETAHLCAALKRILRLCRS